MLRCAVFILLVIAGVYASSHSEAPGTAQLPGIDVTDFYMFRSYEDGREDYVVFLMNSHGLQDAFAGPNYFSPSDQAFYEINIDVDHNCIPDVTFQMFYGNALGGATCDPGETDCIGNHKGIELPIGDKSIAVPLKFVGQVTGSGGSASNLNWNEWYQINKVTPNQNGNQEPILVKSTGGAQFPKPFDNAGRKAFPNYEDYARSTITEFHISSCSTSASHGRTFFGQRAEPFYIKLGAIFDLFNYVPIPGFPGAIEEDNNKNNDLRYKNILTWGFEIHKDCLGLTAASNNIVAAWTSVRTLAHNGDAHVPVDQVSRLANPLVNELAIGLRDKNNFNAALPQNDAQFADYVTNPTLPALLNTLFGPTVNKQLGTNFATIAPKVPRNDLVATFLTGITGINNPNAPNNLCEQMRLNLAIPITPINKQKRYGALAGDNAGYPNGRRPGDDVVDISVQVFMGALCNLNISCSPADAPVGNVQFTDGAPTAATDFQSVFPFLNSPCNGDDGPTCGANVDGGTCNTASTANSAASCPSCDCSGSIDIPPCPTISGISSFTGGSDGAALIPSIFVLFAAVLALFCNY